MRILIAEDDSTSIKFMYKFLSKYGQCDIAVDGMETVDTFITALREEKPYDLICLDIMMPHLDGIKVLKAIRDLEEQNGVFPENRVRVIMTSALNDRQTVTNAYHAGCEAYVWKPVDIDKFTEEMKKLKLID
jgi:two-component system chemotaxis response regulator CheY